MGMLLHRHTPIQTVVVDAPEKVEKPKETKPRETKTAKPRKK